MCTGGGHGKTTGARSAVKDTIGQCKESSQTFNLHRIQIERSSLLMFHRPIIIRHLCVRHSKSRGFIPPKAFLSTLTSKRPANMTDQRAVFFFDIDNCVCILCMMLYVYNEAFGLLMSYSSIPKVSGSLHHMTRCLTNVR